MQIVRLTDYVAFKSVRINSACLQFFDIEKPKAPQHEMITKDEETYDHISICVVKQMLQTLKLRFGVIVIDQNNTSYKLASDVAEIVQISRKTRGNKNISF